MAHGLRVATFNVHAGVDGYGRPSNVVDAAVGLDADVLFLQEAWRSKGVDLAEEIATRSGAAAHTFALATGYRVTGGSGPRRWQPRTSLLTGNHGLFLDSERPLPPAARRLLDSASGVERGEWCVGLVTRLAVSELTVLELGHLPRDRARRRLICATLDHETGPLRCFTLHGAHLSHGSIGQYRELTSDLAAELADDPRAIFGGDLNAWGFVVRRVLHGWRQAACGASWPSWRPHSQLDHLFVRGDVGVLDGGVVDCTASDHRPVLATVSLN